MAGPMPFGVAPGIFLQAQAQTEAKAATESGAEAERAHHRAEATGHHRAKHGRPPGRSSHGFYHPRIGFAPDFGQQMMHPYMPYHYAAYNSFFPTYGMPMHAMHPHAMHPFTYMPHPYMPHPYMSHPYSMYRSPLMAHPSHFFWGAPNWSPSAMSSFYGSPATSFGFNYGASGYGAVPAAVPMWLQTSASEVPAAVETEGSSSAAPASAHSELVSAASEARFAAQRASRAAAKVRAASEARTSALDSVAVVAQAGEKLAEQSRAQWRRGWYDPAWPAAAAPGPLPAGWYPRHVITPGMHWMHPAVAASMAPMAPAPAWLHPYVAPVPLSTPYMPAYGPYLAGPMPYTAPAPFAHGLSPWQAGMYHPYMHPMYPYAAGTFPGPQHSVLSSLAMSQAYAMCRAVNLPPASPTPDFPFYNRHASEAKYIHEQLLPGLPVGTYAVRMDVAGDGVAVDVNVPLDKANPSNMGPTRVAHYKFRCQGSQLVDMSDPARSYYSLESLTDSVPILQQPLGSLVPEVMNLASAGTPVTPAMLEHLRQSGIINAQVKKANSGQIGSGIIY